MLQEMLRDYLALPEVQFFRKWWWAELLLLLVAYTVMRIAYRNGDGR